jgi:hypothetical protein
MGLPGLEPDRGVRVAIEISLEAGNFGGLYIEKPRLQFASPASRESRRREQYCTSFGQLRYLFCLPGEVVQPGHELVRTL